MCVTVRNRVDARRRRKEEKIKTSSNSKSQCNGCVVRLVGTKKKKINWKFCADRRGMEFTRMCGITCVTVSCITLQQREECEIIKFFES